MTSENPDLLTIEDPSDDEDVLDNDNSEYSNYSGPISEDITDAPMEKTSNVFENFNVFLPGYPIEVKIASADLIQRGIFERKRIRDQFSINRINYTIELSHAGYEWKISRKYLDFVSLHKTLFLMNALSRDHEEDEGHSRRSRVPHFPAKIEFNLSKERIEERRKQFENYLKRVVSSRRARENLELIKFLEASPISFREKFGDKKFKEGPIQKFPASASFNCCLPLRRMFKTFWQERWLVIKEGYVIYMEPIKSPNTEELVEMNKSVLQTEPKHKREHHFFANRDVVLWRLCKVILMDVNFRYNFYRSGNNIIIKILNSQGRTTFSTKSELKATEWLSALDAAVGLPRSIDYTTTNRFRSFAPQRHKCQVQAFVDGGAYMYSVAKAIEKAKHEILITGWWVCPEIFLKRPGKDCCSRLDLLLKKKAEENVRICILIYKEMRIALNLDSAYTANYFRNLHPNIHVLRHPDHIKGMVLMWSHHEKSVIIDQSIAFIGGVDLCYGRWDTPAHRLIDVDTNENIESHMDLDRWKHLTSQMLLSMVKKEEEEEAANAEELDGPPSRRRLHRLNSEVAAKSGMNPFLAVNAVKKWKRQGSENKPTVLNLPGGQVGVVMTRQISKVPDASFDSSQRETTIFMPGFGRVNILEDEKSKTQEIQDEEEQPPVVKNLYHHSNDPTPIESKNPKKALIKARFKKVIKKQQDQRQAKQNIKDMLHRRFTFMMKQGLSSDENSSEEDLEIHNNWLTRRRTIANRTIEKEIKRETELDPELKELCSKYMFVGKDYVNWLVRDCYPINEPFTDIINRFAIPRMPWHDAHAVVLGEPAQDFARHFIQRWNDVALTKSTSAQRKKRAKRRHKNVANDRTPPPLLLPMNRSEPWISGNLSKLIDNSRPSFTCSVQALRSAGTWALGLNERVIESAHDQPNQTSFEEVSIVRAYLDMIERSEHYVYIENQFYISYCASESKKSPKYVRENTNTPGSLVQQVLNDEAETIEACETDGIANASSTERGPLNDEMWNHQEVINPIGDAIFRRVLKAHKLKQKFRVYILLPFLGAFEGEVGRPSGTAQHAILYYTRASLFQGDTALFPRLRKLDIDPEEYISINSLRKWEKWSEDRLACEMIYIHDKIMIVDDRRVIIGSANLNDRSMVGARDSELAMIIEDTEPECLIPTTFDGKKTLSGKFCRRFRRALMSEHLGILNKKNRIMSNFDPTLINDPVCDEFFHGVWKAISRRNSEIIEQVFLPIPSAKTETFKSLEQRRTEVPMARSDPQKAMEILKGHYGHLEFFPESFLCQEYLAPRINTKEGLVPYIIWT